MIQEKGNGRRYSGSKDGSLTIKSPVSFRLTVAGASLGPSTPQDWMLKAVRQIFYDREKNGCSRMCQQCEEDAVTAIRDAYREACGGNT